MGLKNEPSQEQESKHATTRVLEPNSKEEPVDVGKR